MLLSVGSFLSGTIHVYERICLLYLHLFRFIDGSSSKSRFPLSIFYLRYLFILVKLKTIYDTCFIF